MGQGIAIRAVVVSAGGAVLGLWKTKYFWSNDLDPLAANELHSVAPGDPPMSASRANGTNAPRIDPALH